MSESISLVLFDLDDVLCRYDRSARIAHLAGVACLDPVAVRQAIWGSGLEGRADAGQVSDKDYLDEMGRLLGCRITLDDWLDARRIAMTPDADVLRLAEAVSARRRIAVLTNNCRLLATHMPTVCPRVAELFGVEVHATASFGAAKPAPEVYLRCVVRLGVAPSETLFIDDVAANVDGAVQAGLQGYVFTGADALARELQFLRLI